MADRDDRRNNDNRPNGRGEFGRSGAPGGDSGRDSRGERSGSRDSRGERGGSRDRKFENRPAQERPGRGGEDRERERPAWQTRVERPRGDDRPKSPMIPEEITEKDLDLLIRVQMKTLSPENAERVARHLAMVGLLIDDDPELAHKHALAAADRAGRIGVVRETLGVTAYTVGDFTLALRELQAFRRISGSNDQLPLMVDSERGLGRPDRALELGRSVPRETLAPAVRANLAIAMSGARLDKGQNDLALSELEVPELNPAKVFDYSSQLFRAYGDTLEILGRPDDAKRWFDLADRADAAVAQVKQGDEDVIQVIEELTIPAPYEPRQPRGERDFEARPKREWSDRPRRDDGDRPSRDSGDRPRRDSSDRPRRDSSDRPSRPSSDRPRRFEEDRPRRDSSDRPRRESSDGARPAWKKRDDQ